MGVVVRLTEFLADIALGPRAPTGRPQAAAAEGEGPGGRESRKPPGDQPQGEGHPGLREGKP